MARLNIEDQFWLEVIRVAVTLGDQDRAIGQAVRFFRFAQEKHKAGKFITEQEFESHEFSEALIGVFAKRGPSGIQAVGAEKHFAWLRQKIEAGRAGGKKSAKRSRDKKGRLISSDGNIHQAKPNEHQPSSSSSSSSSSSNSSSPSFLEHIATEVKKPSAATKSKTHVAEIRATFLEAYKTQFGKDYPGWGAKENGQASNWLRSIPKEKALEYIRAYVSWTEPWIVKAGHDFGLLVSKTPALDAHMTRSDQVYLSIEEHKQAQKEAQNAASIKQFANAFNANVLPISTQYQPKIPDSA